MGDLRNKLAKIERAKRDKIAMNRFLGLPDDHVDPPAPPPPVTRCSCGYSHMDRKLVASSKIGGGVSVWCFDCAPGEVRSIAWKGGRQA